jgi:protein TonB
VLQTLLESRSRKERSTGGAIASVTAHSVLIAAALHATAQARVPAAEEPEHLSHYVPRPTPGRTASPMRQAEKQSGVAHRLPIFNPQINVDINVPTINMMATPNAGDFSPASFSDPAAADRGTGRAINGGSVLDVGQVDRQVSVLAGSQPPRYPEILRASGVEGQLTAIFIVDEQGRVEEPSIRFAQPGNALFEDAVRVGLRRMRFSPAEAGGRKVRQLVQMPFVFTLAR